MDRLLDVRQLSKRFGPIKAVDGVSFKVDRGEVLGFLGPNGAGKSTTMRMVTGYLSPSEGLATVCGFDVVSHPTEVQRRLGYLPEGAPLYGDMTPWSFLNFVADIRGLRGKDKRRRLDAVIEQLHLATMLRQPIETLSKGYKRRVGLAQALVHDPEVLVLDEPTDGLDPNQKHEVRCLLREMGGAKAIVVSTHILEEVEAVCSRAIIIDQGRVVVDASPEQLKRRSRHHNAVAVHLPSAEVEMALQLLRRAPRVQAVETLPGSNGLVRLTAYPADGEEILATVRDCLARDHVAVEEIFVDRGRLDEVFRELTQAD
jgi:gliding motility-associated transport system ATP-binding protein